MTGRERPRTDTMGVPRPRFAKLDPSKRDAILNAAASEFGDLGFERASYNRIIERAGLSKGAMYYYFDDKEDLFATVLQDAADQVSRVLPEVPQCGAVAEYWSSIETLYLQIMRLMTEHPRVAALVPLLCAVWRRSDRPASLDRLDGQMRTWLVELLDVGRQVGAVRDDVPEEMLVSVILATAEAMNTWAMRAYGEGSMGPEQIEPKIPAMVDMIRRLAGTATRVSETRVVSPMDGVDSARTASVVAGQEA